MENLKWKMKKDLILLDLNLPPARLRRFLRERLGRRADSENESDILELADAQFLVTRARGFGSWAQLMKIIEE
jgi:hypothetical protein